MTREHITSQLLIWDDTSLFSNCLKTGTSIVKRYLTKELNIWAASHEKGHSDIKKVKIQVPFLAINVTPSHCIFYCDIHLKVKCDVLYNYKQCRLWSDATSKTWQLIWVYTVCNVRVPLFVWYGLKYYYLTDVFDWWTSIMWNI